MHSPKALLQCQFFTPTEIELLGKRPKVIGVTGRLPIGAVSIRKLRRGNDLWRVVTGGSRVVANSKKS